MYRPPARRIAGKSTYFPPTNQLLIPPGVVSHELTFKVRNSQHKDATYSVRGYVSGPYTNPTDKLSVGSGKPTLMKEKVKATKQNIEAWNKTWDNASGT